MCKTLHGISIKVIWQPCIITLTRFILSFGCELAICLYLFRNDHHLVVKCNIVMVQFYYSDCIGNDITQSKCNNMSFHLKKEISIYSKRKHVFIWFFLHGFPRIGHCLRVTLGYYFYTVHCIILYSLRNIMTVIHANNFSIWRQGESKMRRHVSRYHYM